MERYRVGDLIVDVPDGLVSRAGQAIPVPPLTFNLLLALVRRAPQFVRRDELLSTVWPDEFVSDETLSQRISLLRRALGDCAGTPRYIASVRQWGYKVVADVETIASADQPIRSLAVLPLASLAAGGEQDFLADGFTDALLSSLSKLGSLKVISRTSVMRYRHTEKSLPRIARELGVQALIEGSVLRTGERVWITVQLVRAATDEHIWSESYERDIVDVPALLDEVAATIADAIRAVVSPEERLRLTGRRRVDPAAYEAFLRGAHFMSKYTPAEMERAVAFLIEAVGRDPSFALAHAALAGACILRAVPFGASRSASEQHALVSVAKVHAERAVQLDDTLAGAYAALGSAVLFHDWDWRRAREVLERAIRLEPSSSSAHLQLALVAAYTLQRELAEREARRTVELDPLNLAQRAQCAEILYWIRDYDAAIRAALETLSFDSTFPRAHFVLGRVYEAQRRIAEAVRHYRHAGLLSAQDAKGARSALARGGVSGFHRWALKVGFGAHGTPPTGDPSLLRPTWRAKLHCQAGDADRAIDCLEQAYAEHDALLALLNVDVWDPLRGDPRFQDLVRRVGLPSFGLTPCS